MSSRRRRLCLAALALGASLLAADGASGQGTVLVAGGGPIVFGSAHANGTNGYHVTVSGGGNAVTISASHGRASVSYTVKGRAGGKRLRADFGALGSVNLRFHPRERAGRGEISGPVPVPCESEDTTQRGIWKGQLLFIGEGGFTSASATKLRGRVETIKLDCEVPPPPEQGNERPERPTLFSATSFEGDTRTRTYLTAWRSDFQDISMVSAAVFIPRGRVRAGYSVDREVPRNTLRVNRARTRFHLEGVEPFTGDAAFKRQHRHSGRWAGDLAVTLPVIGPVALTGPGFKAGLRG